MFNNQTTNKMKQYFEDKAAKLIAYCLLLLFAGSFTVVFLLVLNLANYIDLNF